MAKEKAIDIQIKESETDWKTRLVEERKTLLEKTLKLKNTLEDRDTLLSAVEWDMLRHQYGAMREYLQALTDRCVYYELIDAGNLHLDYSGPCCKNY